MGFTNHEANNPPVVSDMGMINILADIHRYLPDELLISIFAEVHSPLTISAVCHLWREIAVNTAALWTTIRCVIEGQKSTPFEKVRTFVARARNAQVLVDVSVQGDASGLEELASVLVPIFPHCRSLCLSFTHFNPAKFFFPLPDNMVDLESLVVTLGSSSDDPVFSRGLEELSIDLFQKQFAPLRLRSFHLFAPQNVSVNFPEFLDMSGMSALSLAIRMPPAKILGLAARAPGLRSLDLMAHQSEPTDDHLVPLSYPRLERQLISGDGWTWLISAPSLHTLTLLDKAALGAVDKAMSLAVHRRRPLFPKLQTLSLMTPEPAALDRGPQFRNLAKFISEHNELLELDIMACWSPIPCILNLSLLQPDRLCPPLPCPKLRTLKLSLIYSDVELAPLLSVCKRLLDERTILKVEFRAVSNYLPTNVLDEFLSQNERATLRR